MDRDEAIRLLRSGKDGIRKFNTIRMDEVVDGVTTLLDLRSVDLSGLNSAGLFLYLADLSDANLNGARLPEACLVGADLRQANLTNAVFTYSSFEVANLTEAQLTKGVFENCKFAGTNLSRANLSEANFTSAYFGTANFKSAKLYKSCWDRVRINQIQLDDVDLQDVLSLETVTHKSPSSIGIDTFVRSGGQIPEAFLRGCGVPDSFITFQRSLVENPIEFYSVFISYSHADKSFADQLHDQLQGRGIRCWIDDHQILPGDNIYREVDKGIRVYDKVLLCASKNSLGSPWVNREVETSIEREMKLYKDRGQEVLSIIPLNLDGTLFEWDGPHAATLRKRLAPEFTGWESDNAKFEREFEKIVKALRSDAGARKATPEPKL